ncbi:MAG: hypothetical protein K2G36_08560 [Ruminococcus sp.]|nr:hypothetical protein [Ruminococcus sp.]
MKKILSVFISAIVILLCVPATVSAEYTMKSASQAIEFYKSVMSNPSWSASSRKDRGEKLQLPEEWLENMTTSALVDAVVEYPYFTDYLFYNDVQSFIPVLYNTFNGVRELAERPDVATVLLQKYKAETVLTDVNTTEDVFRLTDIEILLSQDFVVEKLTDDEISELRRVAFYKYIGKRNSEVHSEYTANMFYNLNHNKIFPNILRFYDNWWEILV